MTYISEQQRRRQVWEEAPKECPYCKARGEGHTPINQEFQQFGNDQPRQHCGSQACRKAHSRATIAKRKEQERKDARARVLTYCNQHLTENERHYVMNMFDLLTAYNQDEGHQIAETVVSAIERKRCKHDRIDQIEAYAALQKRRAEKTEEQLKARIQELEEELEAYQTLEATIHGIAKRQLQKQPEPPALVTEQETDPDPDRPRVLAILQELGIPPYTGGREEQETATA